MNLSPLSIAMHLFLFFFFFIITFSTADVSINCGSAGTSAATNGRQWLGDSQPNLSNSFLQLNGVSTTSTIAHKLSSADPVPHQTARISRSRFSYSFQVNPGQIIIRLHFNPSLYKGFKGLKDLFTVEAGPFTLLSNFSASLTAAALNLNTLSKEFCLNIHENQQFTITFSPESSQSNDTYAFVNGIEIISVPATLSCFDAGDIGLQEVRQNSLLFVDCNTALEIVHRQNIRHDLIMSTRDSDDMFPKWATQKTDKIKNTTWGIPVEVGFRYLIRLHFSELAHKIAGSGDLIFKVLINGMIAHTNTDIMKARGEDNVVLYKDYMMMMRGLKKDGKRDLLISLESHDALVDVYGVLAGFEVVKLSNPDNSLASPNPLPPPQDSPSWTIPILLRVLAPKDVIAAIAVAIISLLSIIVHKLREIGEAADIEDEHKPSAKAERHCRCFSLVEIQLATKNFSDGLLIGRGGFGKVYKGLIDKGKMTIAIKRLKSDSQQGAHEFLTEVETLSELRHINLVSLIGYCRERGEMILVYEYMPSGTLADHLYKHERGGHDSSPLTWKQRLNICIGAGRGVDYIHTGHRIIHRDIKASNILLDENFVAKVSDFGLAKPEDRSKLQSHVSTKVKGTRGYLDAHYINTSRVTRKSDVYAFGVVLLEVLCGRPPLDWAVSENERILTMWARDKISKGEVDQIVASTLREEISPNSLKTFVGIAQRCLDDEPKNRPTMSQVVLQLEDALEQQDKKQPLVLNEISSASDETEQSELQNFTNPPEVESNSKLVNSELPWGKKVVRKGATHKQSIFGTWWVFWNKDTVTKENELLLSEIRELNVKLVKFDWDTIVIATQKFCDKLELNRLGSTYKAVLPTGQIVAVKRSTTNEEFKNEIFWLHNLQHPNTISLLGYCIHREEKFLVYELMQNNSLHNFIDQRKELDWPLRLKIIMGIARGLAYLHQECGLRIIIHRNLELINIFLDSEMNPKISGFASARTLVVNKSNLQTTQIVGTVGHISPEYYMTFVVSVKSDVYSFGIVVLQILSGSSALMWNSSGNSLIMLPEYAWKMWSEGKAVDLVDDNLLEFQHDEVLRCIQVGLLCTQEQPYDRPTMPSVLKMLQGDEPLVDPQKPWSSGKGSVHTSEHGDGVDSTATFEFDDTLER